MNILHARYAIEVARLGSISKAAEQLRVSQPNLSRAIKELENELNITIFSRNSKGILLTPQGEKFFSYAKKILVEIDELEMLYKHDMTPKQSFSISVPRGSYITDAFSRFSNCLTKAPAELFYNETTTEQAIRNIIESGYQLGIIRYALRFDRYYKDLLDEKGLRFELIADFRYQLVMHESSTLVEKAEIHQADLADYIEITHGDPYLPSLPIIKAKSTETLDNVNRHIFIFERGSQFCLLSQNHDTFMWVSPLPDHVMNRYHLVQRDCVDTHNIYRDALIYRKNYTLTELDTKFITELCESRRRYVPKI